MQSVGGTIHIIVLFWVVRCLMKCCAATQPCQSLLIPVMTETNECSSEKRTEAGARKHYLLPFLHLSFQVGSFFWSVCIHRILWERTNPFFPASGSTLLSSVRVASASSKVRVQSRAHMHIQWCNHAPLTEMSNHMILFLFFINPVSVLLIFCLDCTFSLR